MAPMTCSFLSTCDPSFGKPRILPHKREGFDGPGILWRLRCLNLVLSTARKAAQAKARMIHAASLKSRTDMSRDRGMYHVTKDAICMWSIYSGTTL